jgi:hypothetical protein
MKKKKEGAAEILNLIFSAIKKTGVDLKNPKVEKKAQQLAKAINKIVQKESLPAEETKKKRTKNAVSIAEPKKTKSPIPKTKTTPKLNTTVANKKRPKKSTFEKENV